MFQATQRRLALWYTAVMAVLLLLFACGFFFYVRSTLIERIDDTLNHVVEVVQRSLVLEPVGQSAERINLEASFRSNTETSEAVEEDRIELEWFSPEGELLWSTWSIPLEVPLHPNHRGETVHATADLSFRQITEPLEAQGEVVGYLRVSHPWFEVTKPTQQLIVDLAIGTGIMVALVGVSGWWLSRLAMEPIRNSYQQLKQFTADASHELRNPIALIQTNVQVALADPTLTPQEQRQQWQVVERLTRRLGRLVDDLLFLARQDSGIVQSQRQPCPLDALLMEVVEEQGTIAQAEGIDLSLAIADPQNPPLQADPFTLKGDYDQLVRLFTNLVSNAIQYTPTGGQIQVRLNQILRQGGGTQLQIQVEDNGCGIPAQALPHLFDRFYRVDPNRAKSPAAVMGTGLGLAIAQAIVQNHHGQIRVESTPGEGSLFTIWLPLTT